jgi:hypothetical protein
MRLDVQLIFDNSVVLRSFFDVGADGPLRRSRRTIQWLMIGEVAKLVIASRLVELNTMQVGCLARTSGATALAIGFDSRLSCCGSGLLESVSMVSRVLKYI